MVATEIAPPKCKCGERPFYGTMEISDNELGVVIYCSSCGRSCSPEEDKKEARKSWREFIKYN